MTTESRVFTLPDRLRAKADPASVGPDEQHFGEIAASLRTTILELTERIGVLRRSAGREGQEALERDLEIHRLTARRRALQRFGLDVCLGRMVPDGSADGAEAGAPVYIGRFGLTDDATGRRLLLDWRSPAAEPFFGATHGDPMGLAGRRRYRWANGHVVDYWDEAFTAEGLEDAAALDDQSAFIASLGASRSPRMRDVLGTIQADQDAIIRAGSRGALVVDGGPGTGKTVVALHRTAYLLYSDPRLERRRGGVLFIGPTPAYLSYVADVLPSLGEEGVRMGTLRDLVPDALGAGPERDPRVAALKADGRLVDAVEAAVRHHEQPPTVLLSIQTPWCEVRVGPGEWREAFAAADAATPHNEARDQVWEELLGILVDEYADDYGGEDGAGEVPAERLRRVLGRSEELRAVFGRVWPVLDPVGVVGDLWSTPSYRRSCAPWLAGSDLEALQRPAGDPWTVSDLPFLDAARLRIGDPHDARDRRAHDAGLAEQQAQMARVVDELIAADDSELGLMRMLRGQDARNSLVDESSLASVDPDLLAGPFAHVVVDEAQELTDAEWRMLLRRCPSRSFTIVGDRAQARHGFPESWQERLERVGFGSVELASLRINYRTPQEVMAVAEPVIRAALPDANVPVSIRESGLPVTRAATRELRRILNDWLAANDGIAGVIGLGVPAPDALPADPRVRWIAPEASKGLEFDLVVLVDPDRFGDGIEGAVDRYVAMTRTTRQLVLLSSD
ncbi:RNA polymerase recycling motor ATPase HelR [Herbiconiux sp.]|uniref:RNA polymerase recycling motor ATPase HelR n=1 Tax=Herbiconiux sp. TaxID=1871186 RepID=UPI0025BB58A4|nr:RNA polymerase recycling motor ATPase HelR [Herbiconiux sp.]